MKHYPARHKGCLLIIIIPLYIISKLKNEKKKNPHWWENDIEEFTEMRDDFF